MLRNNRLRMGLLALVLVLLASPALAETRPIQIGLIAPIQIFPDDDAVKGVRLNLIYGRNASVTGLDWGLINHTTTGLSEGWQAGLVCLVDTDFLGWQDGIVNVVEGKFEGFQSGFINYAESASGFQLGLVNYAGNMHGLQIGLLNIIQNNGVNTILPIINWSF